MRVTRWTLLWILLVAVLLALWIAILTRQITPGDIIGSFLLFVLALVVIAIMSIIGAVFVGMWVSHRILSGRGFTPFEEEMLRMRQDVRNLEDRIEAIAAKVGVPQDPRSRQR